MRWRLWRTALLAIVLLCLGTAASSSASACSCERIRPTNAAFWLSETEVVVEGVVIAHEPTGGNKGAQKTAILHVDRVWKGKLPDTITLSYHEDGISCGSIPPLGQHVRIATRLTAPTAYVYGLCSDQFADPRFDSLLADYKQRTEAIERNAEALGTKGQLGFARYLQRNHESHRALDLYTAILSRQPGDFEAMVGRAVALGFIDREDDALKQLDTARSVAPLSNSGRGALARAMFEITGQFGPDWKDWSALENHGIPPRGTQLDLSGGNFDDSRLIAIDFAASSLRYASFRGANLTHAALGTDLQGATYDCKTLFPSHFDPQAAGMVNVDGSCAKQP